MPTAQETYRQARHLPDGMPDLSTPGYLKASAALLHKSLLVLARDREHQQLPGGERGYLWQGSLRAVARDCWDAFDGLNDNAPSDAAFGALRDHLLRSGNLLRWQRRPETWWVAASWLNGPLDDAPAERERGGCQYPGCTAPYGVSGNGLNTPQALHQHAALMHGLSSARYDQMAAGQLPWPGELEAERQAAVTAALNGKAAAPAAAFNDFTVAHGLDGTIDYGQLGAQVNAVVAERDRLLREVGALRAAARISADDADLRAENVSLRAENAALRESNEKLRAWRRSAELILGAPLVE